MGLYDQFQVSVKDFLDFSEGSTAKATAEIDKAKQIALRSADLYKQVGELQAVSTLAQQTGELKVQQANLRSAEALQVDPDAKGGTLIKQLQGLREGQKSVEENLLGLQEIENRNFLSDPLGYIKGNLIDKPQMEKNLAQSTARLGMYQSQVQGTQQALQQATSTNSGLKQTLTAEAIEANASAMKVAAQIQSNEATIKGILMGVDSIKFARNSRNEELNARYQSNNAANSYNSLILAQQDATRKEQLFNRQMALYDDQAREKALDLEAGELFDAKLNAGRSLAGESPLSKAELRDIKKVFGTAAGAKYERYYQMGDSVLNNSPAGRYGHTPAAATKTFTELNINLGPEAEATKDLLRRAKEKLDSLTPEETKKLGVTNDPSHAGARADYLNNQVQTAVRSMSKLVTSDATNLRYLGSLNAYLDQPGIANLPVVAKVLKPIADSGVQLADMNNTIDLTVAAIKRGEITTAQAAQFAVVIQRADRIKRASRQWDTMGIAVPDTYNVSISVPGVRARGRSGVTSPVSADRPEITNIADPAMFMSVVTKKLSVGYKF